MELKCVNKDTAELAEKVGYDWYVKYPSQELLAKWLRDTHDIHIYLIPDHKNYKEEMLFVYQIVKFGDRVPCTNHCAVEYIVLRSDTDKYVKTLEKALVRALIHLNNKKYVKSTV